LNYPHQPIVACSSVDIQPLNLKPDSNEYHNFISNITSIIHLKEHKFDRVQIMTDEYEYNYVALLIIYINVIIFFDSNDSFELIGSVDKSKILIRVYSDRIDVVSCECSYFSNHWHERKLCRHIFTAVFLS
jgi:hypothetical protein